MNKFYSGEEIIPAVARVCYIKPISEIHYCTVIPELLRQVTTRSDDHKAKHWRLDIAFERKIDGVVATPIAPPVTFNDLLLAQGILCRVQKIMILTKVDPVIDYCILIPGYFVRQMCPFPALASAGSDQQ